MTSEKLHMTGGNKDWYMWSHETKIFLGLIHELYQDLWKTRQGWISTCSVVVCCLNFLYVSLQLDHSLYIKMYGVIVMSSIGLRIPVPKPNDWFHTGHHWFLFWNRKTPYLDAWVVPLGVRVQFFQNRKSGHENLRYDFFHEQFWPPFWNQMLHPSLHTVRVIGTLIRNSVRTRYLTW